MDTAAYPQQESSPGDDRDETADDRDRSSEEQDRVSEARDRRSQARDDRAEDRERTHDRFDPKAATDRAAAKRDRQSSAGDRRHAKHDRGAASTDRNLSTRERAAGVLDELTGAYRRDPGLLELEREIIRAKRMGHPFVLAFIDVDGLKARNDSQGHAAGDALLGQVSDAIKGLVREYDLLVRFGGDEFLCGISDLHLAEATDRFDAARTGLAGGGEGAFSVGMAELVADDSLDDLINRADAAMYEARRGRTIAPSVT